MIKIKPHHFIDIIKLYGSGIENFIPDKNYNHDFYRITNIVVSNINSKLYITTDADDICAPCKYINKLGICNDSMKSLEHMESKYQWNMILDKRIIEFMNLSTEKTYSIKELCNIVYENKFKIYDVWKEENKEITDKRYNLFCAGALKLLN